MRVEVCLLPGMLERDRIAERSVVVIDVLRATTTMAAALAAGVKEIRLFGEIDEAVRAARAFGPSALLCGERNCLPPPGFHLGNSPGALNRDAHAARTLFMVTTNGTRAIVAAKDAGLLLAGAIVNRTAVAKAVVRAGRDAILVCSGTNGRPSLEDLLGAGAVLAAMGDVGSPQPAGDLARAALALWRGSAGSVETMLRDADGGRNVVAVGLEADVVFAAQADQFDVVGRVFPDPLRVEAA